MTYFRNYAIEIRLHGNSHRYPSLAKEGFRVGVGDGYTLKRHSDYGSSAPYYRAVKRLRKNLVNVNAEFIRGYRRGFFRGLASPWVRLS